MENTITYILISNTVLCFTLSVHWLSSNVLRPLPTRLLGLNFSLYGLQALLLVLILNDAWRTGTILRATFAMLLGPGLYLYYLSVVREKFVLGWVNFVHLLPSLCALSLLLTESPWRQAVELAILASFGLYFFLCIFQMYRTKLDLSGLGEHRKVAFRWLKILSAFMLLNLCSEIGVAIEVAALTELIQSKTLWLASAVFFLANLSLLLIALRRSSLIEWMYLVGVKSSETVAPSQIDEEEVREIFSRWQELVEQQQLFVREGGLSLKDAAKMMQLPVRKLSVAINRAYGASFSQYLNDCRVEKAKQLILCNHDMSLTAVLYDSGFASKSTFNKEFLRVEGMSPSAYRQALLDGHIKGE